METFPKLANDFYSVNWPDAEIAQVWVSVSAPTGQVFAQSGLSNKSVAMIDIPNLLPRTSGRSSHYWLHFINFGPASHFLTHWRFPFRYYIFFFPSKTALVYVAKVERSPAVFYLGFCLRWRAQNGPHKSTQYYYAFRSCNHSRTVFGRTTNIDVEFTSNCLKKICFFFLALQSAFMFVADVCWQTLFMASKLSVLVQLLHSLFWCHIIMQSISRALI